MHNTNLLQSFDNTPINFFFVQLIVTGAKRHPEKLDTKTGDLSGVYGYDIYYDKTSYELAHTILEDNDKTVVVIMAGTRENFYKELK